MSLAPFFGGSFAKCFVEQVDAYIMARLPFVVDVLNIGISEAPIYFRDGNSLMADGGMRVVYSSEVCAGCRNGALRSIYAVA